MIILILIILINNNNNNIYIKQWLFIKVMPAVGHRNDTNDRSGIMRLIGIIIKLSRLHYPD